MKKPILLEKICKTILISTLLLTVFYSIAYQKEYPLLLIKTPTRARPKKILKWLKQCYANLSGTTRYHFLITCDLDDESMNNEAIKQELSSYPNLTVTFSDNRSKIEAYNRDISPIDFDILLAASDDLEPCMFGYDKIIVETMLEKFPLLDGVLNFHDGSVGSACNTYPVVGREFLRKFSNNYLYHPDYKSLFANQELTLISRLLHKEYISNTIIFRHNHPVWGLGEWDDLYIRNENLKERDRAIFDSRRLNNFSLPTSSVTLQPQTPLYFCTAADSKYFDLLLVAIGAIHATNFEQLGAIAVANIGMTEEQINHLKKIEKVLVLEIEKIHPTILSQVRVNNAGKMVPGWYAWKPVAIKQALEKFPYVLWIDATTLILKPLGAVFEYIKNEGNFLPTIGDETTNGQILHPVSWCTTERVKKYFELDRPQNSWILTQELLLSTTFGVSREGADQLITPLYELAKDIGLYADDGSTPDGFGTGRHDQTLLSIIAHKNKLPILKQDHTQQQPTYLRVNESLLPLYITWHGSYVNSDTSIYNARGNAAYYKHYVDAIVYNK